MKHYTVFFTYNPLCCLIMSYIPSLFQTPDKYEVALWIGFSISLLYCIFIDQDSGHLSFANCFDKLPDNMMVPVSCIFFSMQYGHFGWNHGLSCLIFCAWTKKKKMGSMEFFSSLMSILNNNFSTVRAQLTWASISAIFGIMRFFAGPTILLAGTLVLTQFLDKTSVNTTYFWPHYS